VLQALAARLWPATLQRMHTLVSKAASLAATYGKPHLVRLFNRANEDFAEARRIEFTGNVMAHIQFVMQELLERVDDIEQRLEDQAADQQFWLVWRNLGFEADREAIDERRRMLEEPRLAHLVVGGVTMTSIRSPGW
jgi:hypothetical protein